MQVGHIRNISLTCSHDKFIVPVEEELGSIDAAMRPAIPLTMRFTYTIKMSGTYIYHCAYRIL